MTTVDLHKPKKNKTKATIITICFGIIGLHGIGYFYMKKYILGIIFLVITPVIPIVMYILFATIFNDPPIVFSDLQSFGITIQMSMQRFDQDNGIFYVYAWFVTSMSIQIVHTRKLCNKINN